MNKNNITDRCLEYFNITYNSHINNIPYKTYMSDLLDRLTSLIDINIASFIVQYDSKSETFYNLILHNRDTSTCEEDYGSTVMSLLTENSMLTECVTTDTIVRCNRLTYKQLYGRYLTPVNYDNSIDTILLPIKFGPDTKGIIGFFTTELLSQDLIDSISHLRFSLGTLLFSAEMRQKREISIKIAEKDTTEKKIPDGVYGEESKQMIILYKILKDLLNVVDDGLIVLDKCYDIYYYNDKCYDLFKDVVPEVNSENIIGCYIADIIPAFHSVVSSNKKQFFKNKKIPIRKGYYDAVSNLNSVVTGTEIFHIITIRQKNKKNRTKTKKSVKSTKNLIAYMSHELRNPIQAISNGCFVLKAELDNAVREKNLLDDTSECYRDISGVLSNINRNCKDMVVIIDDILDLSKLDTKEFYINLDICNIEELVNMIITDFTHLAEEKNLSLDFNIDVDTPSTLYTDETRIYQILSNLVSNSIKYSDNGTVLLNVSFDKIKHGVTFRVSDEGQGIRSTEISNLFKDYGQTSNSFCNKSTGLGLCVSQKIADALGGQITVETQYRKGSVFTLFHPIKLGSSGIRSDSIKEIKPIKGKILVVDDEVHNASIFKMLLKSFNYRYGFDLCIDIVFSGESAIDTIRTCNNYDIIFMDIDMEGIDGCTAGQILRSKNMYEGPIVATTGNIMVSEYNQNERDKKNFDMFNNVLIKPFNFETILNILHMYMTD